MCCVSQDACAWATREHSVLLVLWHRHSCLCSWVCRGRPAFTPTWSGRRSALGSLLLATSHCPFPVWRRRCAPFNKSLKRGTQGRMRELRRCHPPCVVPESGAPPVLRTSLSSKRFSPRMAQTEERGSRQDSNLRPPRAIAVLYPSELRELHATSHLAATRFNVDRKSLQDSQPVRTYRLVVREVYWPSDEKEGRSVSVIPTALRGKRR